MTPAAPTFISVQTFIKEKDTMEIFLIGVLDFFRAVGWQLLMFFLCGIAFELAAEFVKATLYPKTGEKECPRWLGAILGLVVTIVYLAMAYAAYGTSGAGWYIPGGTIFLPVWFLLFYFWQYKAMRMSKWLCTRLFPTLRDPSYTKPRKEKKEKAVPAGLTEEDWEKVKAILDK